MVTTFPDLLTRTIAARQVTLEALSKQLRAMGTPVSMATLSYWQSGRSVPSRPTSLRALSNLETLLEVAPGHLTSALAGVDETVLWGQGLSESGLQRTLAQMGMAVDRDLVKLVLHETIYPDEVPDQHRRLTRQLVRSAADQVSRVPLVTANAQNSTGVPVVEALQGCHVGETIELTEHGVTVVELVLERPLRQGEESQMSYQVTFHEDGMTPGFERYTRLPVHYLVLEARMLQYRPAECFYEYWPLDGGDERKQRRDLPAGPNPIFVGRNVPPGTHALGWSGTA